MKKLIAILALICLCANLCACNMIFAPAGYSTVKDCVAAHFTMSDIKVVSKAEFKRSMPAKYWDCFGGESYLNTCYEEYQESTEQRIKNITETWGEYRVSWEIDTVEEAIGRKDFGELERQECRDMFGAEAEEFCEYLVGLSFTITGSKGEESYRRYIYVLKIADRWYLGESPF